MILGILKNKVAKNATWIIVSRIIQAVFGLVLNMFIARYLGPSNYGIINYAVSVIAFVVPLMNLGFSNVLVQELTENPEREGKIIGTSIFLSLLSSLACTVGVVTYTFLVDANETITNIVVSLYCLTLFAQAFELIQYWFQAKLLSKYTAIISLVSYILVSIYKVCLLLTKASVVLFGVTSSIDYFLISGGLLFTYFKLGGSKLLFSKEDGKRIFNKSKHYIFSSLMVTIFAQTDKVMLKLMIGEASVGYYSAAVTCAGLSAFVFVAIIDSFRPIIFQRKKEKNEIGYEQNIKRLYSVVIFLALIQSIIMTIFSRLIIKILYGGEFQPSVLALQIIVWYTTFSYIGSVRNIWILGENKQKYLWIVNLGGALSNILLNLVFINLWGIYGAAVASLITQIFTNIVMSVIIWPLHHNNFLILQSLNPKILIDMMKRNH